MKKLFLIIFLIGQIASVAQVGALKDGINSITPAATTLGRFVEQPIGYYAGIPNISIPLYDLQAKGISIPISLSYRASGVKVRDIPGITGLNWNLNCGGAITRVARGRVDDYGVPYPGFWSDYSVGMSQRAANAYYHGETQEFSQSELDDICSNSAIATIGTPSETPYLPDTEADIYYYNFLGYSGRFVFNHKGKAILMPAADLKIERLNHRFKVTDGKGIIYYFDDIEVSAKNQVTASISSWYISRISFPDSDDKILFKYKDIPEGAAAYVMGAHTYSGLLEDKTLIRVVNVSSTPLIPNPYCPLISHSASPTIDWTQNNLIIDEILYNDAKIKFYSSNTRTDVYKWKMDSLTVSHLDRPLRRIAFNYGYFNQASTSPYEKRLRLDDIVMNDEHYRFQYIESYNGKSLPDMATNARDLWGFYNGEDYNNQKPRYKAYALLDNHEYYYYSGSTEQWLLWNSVGSQEFFYFGGLASTARNADYKYGQIGTLKSIIYPTGGKVEYEYEGNDFANYSFNFPYNFYEPIEKDPGTQIIRSENHSATVDLAAYPNSASWSESGMSEITIHKDQTVNFNYTYGLLPSATYQHYIDLLLTTGETGTTSIELLKYNSSSGEFESIRSFSLSIFDTFGFLDDASVFDDLKPSLLFTNTESIFLTEGRYRITSHITGADMQGSLSVGGIFPYKQSDDLYYAGGLRIKKIRITPGENNGVPIVKEYFYTKDGKSSGVIESPFSNISVSLNLHGTEGCNFVNVLESSVIPLGNAQGGTIGYSRVTEKTAGNGSVIYDFTTGITIDNVNGEVYADRYREHNINGVQTRTQVSVDNSWKRGLPEKTQILDENNNIVQESYYKYKFEKNTIDTAISMVMEFRPDLAVWSTFPMRFWFCLYQPYLAEKILDSTILYTTDGKNITNVKKWEYAINKHPYPVKEISFNSQGQELSTTYKYPADYTTGDNPATVMSRGIRKLRQDNKLSAPVEVYRQRRDAGSGQMKTTAAGLTTFKEDLSFPDKVFKWEQNQAVTDFTPAFFTASTSGFDGRYQAEQTSLVFDNNGNLIQQEGRHQMNAFVWGGSLNTNTGNLNGGWNSLYQYSYQNVLDWTGTGTDAGNTHNGMATVKISSGISAPYSIDMDRWINVLFHTTKKVKFSAWVYSDKPSVSLGLLMKRNGETGNYTYYDFVQTTVLNTWVLVEKELTVPADVTSMKLRLINGGVTSGTGNVWCSEAKIEDYYIKGMPSDYQTAQVVNAASNEIAYTSFEMGETGNWNVPGNERNLTKSVTGKTSYSLSSGAITCGQLTNSKEYIVTYWSDGGQATIPGTTVSQGATVNGWTFYEHRIVAGTTNVSVSGSTVIDELRLYPADALMTSYTYEPFVGVSCKIAPDGLIERYEYDAFGRLRLVRDMQGNIVKRICYNYAGQPSPCEN